MAQNPLKRGASGGSQRQKCRTPPTGSSPTPSTFQPASTPATSLMQVATSVVQPRPISKMPIATSSAPLKAPVVRSPFPDPQRLPSSRVPRLLQHPFIKATEKTASSPLTDIPIQRPQICTSSAIPKGKIPVLIAATNYSSQHAHQCSSKSAETSVRTISTPSRDAVQVFSTLSLYWNLYWHHHPINWRTNSSWGS